MTGPTLAAPAGVAALPSRYSAGFRLFLLVNVAMFVRPAELSESLAGLPIYNIVILLCLVASLPVVLRQLTWRSLRQNPITACVVALVPAIAMSQLVHGQRALAIEGVSEFVKVVAYYLLLVGLVDSERRLRTFLVTVVACVIAASVITLLNFYDVIHLATEASVAQHMGIDELTGEYVNIPRLQSLGIFSDPNDFALVLAVAMLVVVEFVLRQRRWVGRTLRALPLPLLGYAFAMTQSRGGFLAFLAGLAVMFVGRWGGRRATVAMLLVAPLILLAAGGRQLDVNLDEGDTGMGRVELWAQSLVLFHHAPLFGIGIDRLPEEIGLVSHNTYVHCFAELGLFGAAMFIGALYLAIDGVRRSADPSASAAARAPSCRTAAAPGTLLSWRSCVLAILAAYAVGIYSLSRPYVLPTYLVIGTGAAFVASYRSEGVAGVPPRRNVLKRVAIVTVLVEIFLEVFVRIAFRAG